MHTTVYSGAILGIDGLAVEVEVDIARGIPCFSIVGLPNTAVRESRERVTAALKNAGWEFPLKRITVNLAPADIKKEGAAFDLAIAVGILVASGQATASKKDEPPVARTLFLGELALDASLRRVPGALPMLLHARARGFARAVVPAANLAESRAVESLEVVACERLRDAVGAVFGASALPDGAGENTDDRRAVVKAADEAPPTPEPTQTSDTHGDMQDVAGQEAVKRALVVAAAGGHHVLMVGPPGAGKTMLARRFGGILPPLSHHAALQTTMIYSIVGMLRNGGILSAPPFRAPHHSASDAGLIGGGAMPRPGEVTLAHNGVLFMDELPEFRRHVLESLREPLEEGVITISRARSAVTFPARFQLVAAMNPCPCGYHGSRERQCRCSPLQIENYVGKISGPLLDRIAIHARVQPVDPQAFRDTARGESTQAMRTRVIKAREIQTRRFAGDGLAVNARIPERRFREWCRMESDAELLLAQAQRRFRVSARGRAHLIRVARTIADLEGAATIASRHLAEAIQYRVPGA
ncbi:MAG: YifB family Mg chelatase-like AAA ATPase [Candidatus Krumholzibacteria bacterium]|nr:YifB family Mg chelatase-like AAA ATPase [Candidatus Krumholzibacteria bacterium]